MPAANRSVCVIAFPHRDSDLVTEYWPDTTKNYTFHANRPLTNTSYHRSHSIGLYGIFQDERFKLTNSKSVSWKTLQDILSTKPVCNNNTFVSTIMEFNNDYNELRISPGRPDSIGYLVYRINNFA